jgi:hypothetical protein
MKNVYALTEQQIESMTADRTAGLSTIEGYDQTYLRVLVNGAQAKLGAKRGKRQGTESQLEALENVAGPFYAAVLRGVTSPDVAPDGITDPAEITRRTRERNRRATFARTAKSTIVTWVNEGGDIRAIDVTTVTKTELRTAINTARSERGETSARRIETAQAAILAAAAREEPDKARELLVGAIAALQAALEETPAAHGSTTVIRTQPGVMFRGHVQRRTHHAAVQA